MDFGVLGQVLSSQIRDSRGLPSCIPVFGGVVALVHLGELLAGLLPSLIGCQDAVLADGEAFGTALAIAVLDEVRTHARGLNAQAKTTQL